MKANTSETEQDARLRRLREGQPICTGNPSRRVRKRRKKKEAGIAVLIEKLEKRNAKLIAAVALGLSEDERKHGRIIDSPAGGWRRESI